MTISQQRLSRGFCVLAGGRCVMVEANHFLLSGFISGISIILVTGYTPCSPVM